MAVEVAGLVGREKELTRAEAVVARAQGCKTVALRLAGEPGIGKTRLLGELAARAERRRFTVLEGRASEYETGLPFGVFVDALDAYAGALDAGRRRSLGSERLAALAPVFPSLAREVRAGAPSVLQEERHRTHTAIRALLELIAAARPLLLVLDDVHWADAASLELLGHLLRRRPQAPLALMAAYRPGEAPPALERALEGLETTDSSLDLGPLAPGAARLLTDGLREERRAALYQMSGGNPFYLLQLAGSDEADPDVPTPEAIRRSLAREVRLAPERARVVAKAAAVTGEPFTPELTAAAAMASEADVLVALDELIALDLVRPGDAPREFRFRHPLVLQAIYEETEAAWRLGAHERVAATLAATGAPLERRALHVERCIRPGDEEAVELLTQAAHAASAIAPGTAARWFEAALRALPHDADATRRMSLLIPLATAHGAGGHLAESRDALRRLLAELPDELAALRAPLIAFVAMAEHLLGHHDTATAVLREALESLPADDRSLDAIVLRSELAGDAFYRGDVGAMLRWSEEALELAGGAGDEALLATVGAQAALARYSVGDMPVAERLYDTAAGIADRLDDDALAGRLFCTAWLSWYGQSADRQEEGVAHAQRGIAVCRATGQGHLLVPLTIGRSIGLTWLGRLEEAAAAADDAVEMAHLAANDQYLAWSATLRCWIHVNAGELAEAVVAGQRGVASAARTHDNLFTTLAGCYLGEAYLEAGDARRGRDEILRAAGGPELEPIEHPFRPRFYEILTRAEIALGDFAAAAEWAARAWADAEAAPIPARRAEALRARAAVALARDEPAEAAGLADEAGTVAEQRSLRLEAARGRLLAGRALAARGDEDGAVARLRSAAEVFSACGANRLRDIASSELRRLGGRTPTAGRRRGPARSGGLSARQLEIARLVAAGHTNREIAEQLFLSERTVETHLANAFTKLGVRSRAAVAVAIAREDPTSHSLRHTHGSAATRSIH